MLLKPQMSSATLSPVMGLVSGTGGSRRLKMLPYTATVWVSFLFWYFGFSPRKMTSTGKGRKLLTAQIYISIAQNSTRRDILSLCQHSSLKPPKRICTGAFQGSYVCEISSDSHNLGWITKLRKWFYDWPRPKYMLISKSRNRPDHTGNYSLSITWSGSGY